MLKVRRQSFRSIVITGIKNGSGITKRLLDTLVRELVQDDIAAAFLGERTMLGALKAPKSASYKRWKRRQALPFGNKKGHLFGKTQRTLDRNKLWTINFQRPTAEKDGRATIILDRAKFLRLVPYMKFYEKGFTQQGAGILIVAKKHVDALQKALRGAERKVDKSGAVRQAVRQVVRRTRGTGSRNVRRTIRRRTG